MAANVEDGIEIIGLDVGELDGIVPEVLLFQKGDRYWVFGKHGDRAGIKRSNASIGRCDGYLCLVLYDFIRMCEFGLSAS